MNSNDKGWQTAVQMPFLYIADVVMTVIELVADLVMLPFRMIGALFDSDTP